MDPWRLAQIGAAGRKRALEDHTAGAYQAAVERFQKGRMTAEALATRAVKRGRRRSPRASPTIATTITG